jgi:FkbM family methyltransferase
MPSREGSDPYETDATPVAVWKSPHERGALMRIARKLNKLAWYASHALRKLSRLDRFAGYRLLSNSPDLVVELKDSPAKMIADVRDTMMSRSLILTGIYEPHVTKVFKDIVKPDSVILDIGANVGYFSVLGASLAPRGKVYAFEPDPGNYRRLVANIYLNGYQGRVEHANMAVGDKAGEILLTNLDAGNAGGRLTVDNAGQVESLFGKDFAYTVVPCVSLDERLGDQKVDVIKIDIEGYEPKAFAGMKRIISENRPDILSEFSPSNLANIGGMDPRAFLGFFLELGYPLTAVEFETGRLIEFGSDPDKAVKYVAGLGVDHVDLFFRRP